MRVAIVLEHDRAVAVAQGGRATRATVPFDADDPGPCVEALRRLLGGAPEIRLVIGLAFLEPAAPELPPVGPDARRQMLELESDRWFPAVGDGAAVALAGDGPLALATESGRLNRWLLAFERWGSIEAVEPAPIALARMARRGGDVELLVPAAPGETGFLRLRDGQLLVARRLPAGVAPPASAHETREAAHEADAATASLTARDVPAHAQLLPAAARRTLARRHRLGLAFAWGALAAALTFAALSAARWRERTLGAIDAAIAAEQPAVDAALMQRDRLQALRAEAALVSELMGDPAQPSRVLDLLARRLPRDAVLGVVRSDSSGWEISGTARDASAVVGALAADSALVEVRAVGGSTRYNGPRGPEESFAVAFRVRGARAPR